jgi:hypothetical protein
MKAKEFIETMKGAKRIFLQLAPGGKHLKGYDGLGNGNFVRREKYTDITVVIDSGAPILVVSDLLKKFKDYADDHPDQNLEILVYKKDDGTSVNPPRAVMNLAKLFAELDEEAPKSEGKKEKTAEDIKKEFSDMVSNITENVLADPDAREALKHIGYDPDGENARSLIDMSATLLGGLGLLVGAMLSSDDED